MNPTTPAARVAEIEGRIKAAKRRLTAIVRTDVLYYTQMHSGAGKGQLIPIATVDFDCHAQFSGPGCEVEANAHKEAINNAFADLRYLLDRVRELESEIRERRAGQQSMTQRRHELEAELTAAHARAEKAEAEAAVWRQQLTEERVGLNALLAKATTLVQKAEAERDALRAEVARLGPEQQERSIECGTAWITMAKDEVLADYPSRRTIRVVQPQEGAGR